MGIRKNMVSNLLLTSSTIIFPLITFPYVTRTLSTTNLGNVLFVDAFTQYFIIFSSLGIPYYGVREIAKLKDNQAERTKLVISLVTLQFTLAIILSTVFIIISHFIPSLFKLSHLVLTGCLTIIATAFSIEWFYQGIESFTYITKRSLFIKLLSVIGILLLVRNRYDDGIYYIILFVVAFLNSSLNFFYFLKSFYSKFNGRINIKVHLKPLLILFSINVSISVYTILDTIILGLFTDPINVSYYSIPLKLVKIIWSVVGGLSVVLIPRISSLYNNNSQNEIVALLTKSLNLVLLLTIPFSLFCLLFSEQILFLIFGTKYVQAVPSLQILSTVPLIIGVCNVFGTQFLLPIGKERIILIATILGLLSSVLLNFLLIPHLKFVGSAIACLLAELVVCLYICIRALRVVKFKFDTSLLMQIGFSCIVTYFASFIIKVYLNNLVLIISACFIYISTFFLSQLLYFKNAFINSLIKFRKGVVYE